MCDAYYFILTLTQLNYSRLHFSAFIHYSLLFTLFAVIAAMKFILPLPQSKANQSTAILFQARSAASCHQQIQRGVTIFILSCAFCVYLSTSTITKSKKTNIKVTVGKTKEMRDANAKKAACARQRKRFQDIYIQVKVKFCPHTANTTTALTLCEIEKLNLICLLISAEAAARQHDGDLRRVRQCTQGKRSNSVLRKSLEGCRIRKKKSAARRKKGFPFHFSFL